MRVNDLSKSKAHYRRCTRFPLRKLLLNSNPCLHISVEITIQPNSTLTSFNVPDGAQCKHDGTYRRPPYVNYVYLQLLRLIISSDMHAPHMPTQFSSSPPRRLYVQDRCRYIVIDDHIPKHLSIYTHILQPKQNSPHPTQTPGDVRNGNPAKSSIYTQAADRQHVDVRLVSIVLISRP